MAMLAARLEPLGCELRGERKVRNARRSQRSRCVCAAGVANLASLPGNVPSATGAKRGVILGQVTYV